MTVRRTLLLVGVLLLASIPPDACHGQESLLEADPAWWSGPANDTYAVALGDVDGDGDLDLVCGNSGQSNTLYLNNGGIFTITPVWSSDPVNETTSVALGDVDGDGDLDLVCGNDGQCNTLYLNKGGVFATSPAWSSDSTNSTFTVLLGDVDGDGDLDLVCGSARGNALYLNEDGVFTSNAVWQSDLNANSNVALGDIDGDGALDFVCGNRLYLNEGGVFSTTSAWSGGGGMTSSISLGDVDGDGDLDLVCGNIVEPPKYPIKNTLYLNEGGVFSETPVWQSEPETVTYGVSLGDVDGDGDLDLVCGNVRREITFDSGERNTLYLNEGGTLSTTPAWSSNVTNVTQSVALGDVDGDGDLDLVCGNEGQSNTLYLNEGGAFETTPAWSSDPTNSTSSVALGDVDGDGDLDLACGNVGQSNTLYLNESGVLATTPGWHSDPTNSTTSVALVDIDGDGNLDLVCGNGGQSNTLYLNEGGALETTPAWSSDTTNSTSSVALGDVDGDGDLDLACGNVGQSNTLYLNESGVLATTPGWHSDPTNSTTSVALGDVDGDGDLDLVCGNYGQSNTVYQNTGDRFSTTPTWLSVPANYTLSVALGDVDGDGDLDLACGNEGQSSMLYLNEGGGLSRVPVWSTGKDDLTSSLAFGDADGDGDLDLVCGNDIFFPYYMTGNALYLNEKGVLSKKPTWTTGPSGLTREISLGDVDGDGDMDLVCGNDHELPNVMGNTLYRGRRNLTWSGGSASPENHLPNNCAGLAWVSARPIDRNTYHVGFVAVDVESDPVWILPEYHFRGDPVWTGADVNGRTGRVGPFASSPEGIRDSLEWDVSRMPFDRRDVELRLKTIEVPRRVSVIQRTSSYLKAVGPIPSIAAHATPNTGTEFFENRDVTVELSLPMDVAPDQARLAFRKGGEDSYQETGFGGSTPKPMATISRDWIGARGIEYWAEVTTASGALTDPRRQPSVNPKTIRVTVTNLKEPSVHPGEQYRIMSIPLELERSLSMIRTLQDDLGFPDPVNWRMFAYDQSSARHYVEVPNDTLSSFEQGTAYWLITRDDHRLDTAPIFGTSTPTDSAFVLTLRPGYNLVGQPFAFSVAWSSMSVNELTMADAVATMLVEPAVAWTGDRYQYGAVEFRPWEGYWVKNLTDSSLVLKIPPREAASTAAPAGESAVAGLPSVNGSAGEWTVRIGASSVGAVDSYNYVGMRVGASADRDMYDRSEAPMSPGRSVSLYFPHPSWEAQPGDYTVDIRGRYQELDPSLLPSADGDVWGQVWRFDVAKNFCDGGAGDEVALEFEGVDDTPENAEIILVDRLLGQASNLREKSRYTYFQGRRGIVTSEDKARFMLVIGSESFLEMNEDLPELPAKTVLYQNYPNPFNPSTLIRYDVAAAGKVTVCVYDVRGALVRVLEDRVRGPGRYEIGWSGENENGTRVASGVYFYRLTAPGISQTRKMVLIE